MGCGRVAALTGRGRAAVNGTVTSKTMASKTARVSGDASIGTVTASRVAATLLSADVVETGILKSPSGTITIDANLALSTCARRRPRPPLLGAR